MSEDLPLTTPEPSKKGLITRARALVAGVALTGATVTGAVMATETDKPAVAPIAATTETNPEPTQPAESQPVTTDPGLLAEADRVASAQAEAALAAAAAQETLPGENHTDDLPYNPSESEVGQGTKSAVASEDGTTYNHVDPATGDYIDGPHPMPPTTPPATP